MKVNKSKEIFVIILLFPIFILLSLNGFNRNSTNSQPYSIYNIDKEGMSVYYETLKKLDYKPRLLLKRIENTDISSIILSVAYDRGKDIDVNGEEIKNWIEKGGHLIYITDNIDTVKITDDNEKTIKNMDKRDDIKIINWGKGELVVLDVNLLINETIVKDRKAALYLTNYMEKWKNKEIYFDEFYLYGTQKSKKSIWHDMPDLLRLIILQLFLGLVAIIFYKGKRFGKPIDLYEETERIENEYIYSVASLYQQGGFLRVVVNNYYEDLIDTMGREFCTNKSYIKENLIEIWQKENLKKLQKVKRLVQIMNKEVDKLSDKKTKNQKQYKEAILIMEDMKKILVKRRENQWKQLKIK